MNLDEAFKKARQERDRAKGVSATVDEILLSVAVSEHCFNHFQEVVKAYQCLVEAAKKNQLRGELIVTVRIEAHEEFLAKVKEVKT